MALPRHLELSSFIKSVHQELRENSRLLGPEIAWKKHCENKERLEEYATAMKELASNYWKLSLDNEENQQISRIAWIHKNSEEYFSRDIFYIRIKESHIMDKINQSRTSVSTESFNRKLRVLDVGSCYNPFQQFSNFDITAIDIAPATKSVTKCDFLKVKTGKILILKDEEIIQLPNNYFDIIIFSLFLEYLPCHKQRKICCTKAYELLKPEGILMIITPDSNHIGSNAKYIKSWRFVLAKIGFSRIKYEKLQHVHCMIFRKVPYTEITLRWAEIHKNDQTFDELYIPQDFKMVVQKECDNKIKLSAQDIANFNNEMPFKDTSD
ncbi:S-adenosylmethionine sensor upstream of mTORC1 [Diorhabda sublineata]|uniref:S-adenosylmethionine sensor upstream of mTORC1 n=1 Tax=Diorhabda sublineata TaxID=1163346 RepID=UPI0024E0AB60|nr:S-adenosylmethionine sensor upstream of mTORC1 [Diorhabda sublineata]